MTRKLYFHNKLHYGDCFFSLHLLTKISQINDVSCDLYCKSEYQKQLQEFIKPGSNIYLTNQENPKSIDLWGSTILGRVEAKDPANYESKFYSDKNLGYTNVNKYLLEMNKLICEELDLKCPFKRTEDIFFDEDIFNENTLKMNFDFLLINSYCLSGQVRYSPNQQDMLFLDIIEKIKSKNKTFITTKKLLHYPSTTDHNLSLVQIGQLSKNCKTVLGVPTAPFLMCLNKFALQNFEKIVNITHDICTFEYGEKCITINSPDSPLSPKILETIL